MSIRVGQGIDVHAFSEEEDRSLRLGGVDIPEGPGLAGHSDADVVLHAVVDALLGAAGLGDIGAVFGTSDPRWAGADSSVFVAHTMSLLDDAGLVVGNVDCTVVAARPRLSPYRERMRERLAELLGAAPDRVSVKATTTDGLGLTGRGEGIACLAIALVESRA
jgi:2-C-methyl-D-erythritol 2,4-cyclodiphosphate synthase